MMFRSVAIVCNYELKPDRIGGMDRFYKAFNTALLSKDYKITWYFKNYNGFEFYKELNIVSTHGNSVERYTLKHIKDNNLKYDIIITHFTELCTRSYKEFKSLTKAYIIAVDHNPRPFEGVSVKKQIKNKLKGRLYGKYINKLVGVSQYTVNAILKDYGGHLKSKTTLVYNGIETSIFKKQIKRGCTKFIVASHLRPSKGIQDLLMALTLLNGSVLKQVKVDIYGEGPMEVELKNLTKQYELNNIVTFCGSSASLPDIYALYDYMIQPTYMECFSLSLLESLASNVPVITTQVGGNLEIIEDGVNGYIVKAGDYKAVADTIKAIVEGQKAIKAQLNTLIEKDFSLQVMVENHLNLLPCT